MTSEVGRLLSELDRSWTSARSGPSYRVHTMTVGGLALRIEGAGEGPGRLLPALSHHPASTAQPGLTIRVWDLGVARYRPLIRDSWFHTTGRRPVAGSGVHVRYDWPQGALQVWDESTGVAYWCIEHAADIEWWEEAAPFRPVLAWWFAAHDRHLAHGAALSIDGKAALFVGPGGSGKSTTALRAQRAGIGFLGDDYCIVAAADAGMGDERCISPDYLVASLYRTVKLRPLDRADAASSLTRNAGGRKVVLSLDDSAGGPLVLLADLRVVAAVSIGDESETRITPGRAGSVLTALAPTSLQQLPGAGERGLSAFATMLRRLPTAEVSLGSSNDGVVAMVCELIASHS